jgi:hypothetical protein
MKINDLNELNLIQSPRSELASISYKFLADIKTLVVSRGDTMCFMFKSLQIY